MGKGDNDTPTYQGKFVPVWRTRCDSCSNFAPFSIRDPDPSTGTHSKSVLCASCYARAVHEGNIDPRSLNSCGHPDSSGISPHATMRNGKTICLPCAEADERRQFLAVADSSPWFCYLSKDDKGKHVITTWTGEILARAYGVVERRNGFHGSKITYFRAVDSIGREWYGRGLGEGMANRIRLTADSLRRVKGSTP